MKTRHAIGLCPHQPSANPAEAKMQYTCMFPGQYHYARVKFRSSDLGGVEENVSYLPTSKNEPLLLLSLCLPQAALGQTCLLSGMERALERETDGERWRRKEAPHLYKVSGTIQACRLWQMEAIKGRGLAGAQLTTIGAVEEGDTDQDPCLCRDRTSELWGGGSLAICSAACLSEQTWPVCCTILSICLLNASD